MLRVTFQDLRIVDEDKIYKIGSELVNALEVAQRTNVALVLDFSHVKSASMPMYGKLVLLRKAAIEANVKIILSSVSEVMYKVLAATRLGTIFEIVRRDETNE